MGVALAHSEPAQAERLVLVLVPVLVPVQPVQQPCCQARSSAQP